MTVEPQNIDLIFYGGSFDPPHQGHYECIKLCMKYFPHADITILPSPSPAAASSARSKETSIPFRERLKLCYLAFDTLLRQGSVMISPFEETLAKPNYTYLTLQALKKKHPDKNLAFLLGSDQFEHFGDWKHPEEILKIADLIVVKRDNKESTPKPLKELAGEIAKKFANNTDLSARIHTIDEKVCPATSTHLREYFDRNEDPPPGWLQPSVLSYIRRNGYYLQKQAIDDECS